MRHVTGTEFYFENFLKREHMSELCFKKPTTILHAPVRKEKEPR